MKGIISSVAYKEYSCGMSVIIGSAILECGQIRFSVKVDNHIGNEKPMIESE